MKRAEHIKRELDILYKVTDDVPIKPFTDIMIALGKKFDKVSSKNNQEFLSHVLTSTIESLLSFQVLTPLFGDDDEWEDVTKEGQSETVHQNLRLAPLFKINGKADYLNAIIWRSNDKIWAGNAWHNGIEYSSNRMVSFPFIPRTFYVEVVQEGDIFLVKDDKTFLEAIDYFNTSHSQDWIK